MSIRTTIIASLGLSTLAAVLSVSAVSAQDDGDRDSAKQVWLTAHNAERIEFGTAPLKWNESLAREAEDWARQLARENRLRHSPRETRKGTGENLWMGTAGAYRAADMIEAFAEEKRYFKAGTFPQVSRTGNWGDVGHYTQIVWAETREVGCATVRGAYFDVLVCRYWPAGNVIGTPIAPRAHLAQR